MNWQSNFPLMFILFFMLPVWANDCASMIGTNNVTLTAGKSLQFGKVGIGSKKRGWLMVDQSGGYVTSHGVTTLGKIIPSPGTLKLTAPPGSTIFLRTYITASKENGAEVELSHVTLGYRYRPLEQNGDDWILHMPTDNTGRAAVEAELNIGAKLSFHISGVIPIPNYVISIECTSIQLP